MHGYWILDNNTFVMNIYFVCFLAVVQCKWHSHMYFIYRAYHQTSVKKEVFSCRTRSSYDKLWCWVCESITNYRTGCLNKNHLKLIKLICIFLFTAVILSCKILIWKHSLYPTSLLRTKKSWDFDMYVLGVGCCKHCHTSIFMRMCL